MNRLRVRHEFVIHLHPAHYTAQGTIELVTDVDYAKLSETDRAFLDDLVRSFEERAAKLSTFP